MWCRFNYRIGIIEADYDSTCLEEPVIDLRWNIDYEKQNINFILEVTEKQKASPLTTIIGIGMSDRGLLTNADIALVRYNDVSIDILVSP